jgi:hypothetical protein
MNIIRRKTLIGAAILLLHSSGAHASCGGANCFLVTGTQEGMVQAGGIVVDLSYRFVPMDQPQTGSEKSAEALVPAIDFETGTIEPDHHRELRTNNELVQLDVAFGVSDRTSVAIAFPLINNRLHEHVDLEGGTETFSSNTYSGFGDLRVMVRRNFHHSLRHLFIGGFGIKTPTGEYKLRDPVEGVITEPGVQPGTGSWDPIATAFYAYQIRPRAFDWFVGGSVQYTTENDLDYRFGETVILNTGVDYQIARGGRDITLSAQINARNAPHDEFSGQTVPSTGGTWIYFTPGVRVATSERTSLYAHVQLPVYQRVNESNIVPRYGLMMGVSHNL